MTKPTVTIPDIFPSADWLAGEVCDIRNQWCALHEESWLEDSDNEGNPDPDTYMGAELRKRIIAYIEANKDTQ